MKSRIALEWSAIRLALINVSSDHVQSAHLAAQSLPGY